MLRSISFHLLIDTAVYVLDQFPKHAMLVGPCVLLPEINVYFMVHFKTLLYLYRSDVSDDVMFWKCD